METAMSPLFIWSRAGVSSTKPAKLARFLVCSISLAAASHCASVLQLKP